MNLFRYILSVVIMTFLVSATVNAKIVTWSIHPKYEKLIRYYGDIYVFQQNGKWGLVQSGGKEILPADNDFITPFANGYALAGINDGKKYLLKSIIDKSGRVFAFSEKYYLPSSNQYISENKLVVVDDRGKYGYIDPNGRVAVKCQFDYALPFKEGWASVKQGNYTKYISDRYDINSSQSVLAVDFHYGDMTMASCFSDGKAAVAYNRDFALIGINGQKIRKLGEAEFKSLYKKNNAFSGPEKNGFSEITRYSVIAEDGKFGLKDGKTTIVKPQFDAFVSQYDDESILTMMNGKYGLVKIIDGNIDVVTSLQGKDSDILNVDRKGNLESITFDYTIPSDLNAPKIFVDCGNGKYNDMTSQINVSGGRKSLSVTPIIAKKAKSCILKTRIENDGIILADFEKTFVVKYPIRLRISAPGPSTIRANENDNATFSSTIFNDSDEKVTVTATWSTGRSVIVTIPAHGSRIISETVQVSTDYSKNISVSLSTGERAHSIINFKTFF